MQNFWQGLKNVDIFCSNISWLNLFEDWKGEIGFGFLLKLWKCCLTKSGLESLKRQGFWTWLCKGPCVGFKLGKDRQTFFYIFIFLLQLIANKCQKIPWFSAEKLVFIWANSLRSNCQHKNGNYTLIPRSAPHMYVGPFITPPIAFSTS